MKTIININGVKTEITLTAEQVKLVKANSTDWKTIDTFSKGFRLQRRNFRGV